MTEEVLQPGGPANGHYLTVQRASEGNFRFWYAAVLVGGAVAAVALGYGSSDLEFQWTPLFYWFLLASLPMSAVGLGFVGPGRPWWLSAIWVLLGLLFNFLWLRRRDRRFGG